MAEEDRMAHGSPESSCFYCGTQGDHLELCRHCENVSFCSDDHRLIHRPQNATCSLFTVASDPDRGHFLLANRAIEQGEIIFTDHPFVLGPVNKSPAACLECLRLPSLLSQALDRCPECALPLCQECRARSSEDRKTSSFHEMECHLFRATFERISPEHRKRIFESIDCSQDGRPCSVYACISVLRLLLVKQAQPQIWADQIARLMDHETERRKDQKTWVLNHMLVAGFLRGACRLDATSEEIHQAIGILRTNGVKLETPATSASGNGLYPTFSLLNHSCICNTRTRKNVDGRHALALLATKTIEAGQEITTRYTTPQWGTLRRQQMLQSHWHFACDCPRCVDPTECGSMLNALKCDKCSGYLLPLQPRDIHSIWKCEECRREVPPARALEVILKVEARVEAEFKSVHVDEATYMQVIGELTSDCLHPNHFLVVLLKEKLVQSLIWRQKHPSTSLEDKQSCLEKQIHWFGDILGLMRKVDPPTDLWEDTFHKMKRDLETLNSEIAQLDVN